MPSVFNSANLLECVKLVQEKYPDAKIEIINDGELWRLVSNDIPLSNSHNSHYACWAEARELLNVASE